MLLSVPRNLSVQGVVTLNAKHTASHWPLYLITVSSLVPVFLLACWVPTLSQEQALVLDRLLDQHLLGQVGVWSSNFALMSKAVANYVAIAAPLCSIGLALLVCRHHLRPLELLPVLSLRRQLFFHVGWGVVVGVLLAQNYFGYTDFAHHRAKFRWVGNHPGLYPFFASMMLLALEFAFVFSYVVLVHYPLLRLARRRKASQD